MELLSQLPRYDLLTREEECDLARAAKDGSIEARDRLIMANLGLIIKMARKTTRQGMPVEDLVDEGVIGMMEAIKGFDPDRGIKFCTYSMYWVGNAMRSAVVANARMIRVPDYISDILFKWKRTEQSLVKELGRPPDFDEIADRLELGGRKREFVRAAMLSRSIEDDTCTITRALGGIADRDDTASEEEYDPEYVHAKIRAMMRHLNHQQHKVITMRFGLDGKGRRLLREIGDELGLCRERVRQIEEGAMRRLRSLWSPP